MASRRVKVRQPSLEGGGGVEADDPSSLEDNPVATPASSTINLYAPVRVGAADAGLEGAHSAPRSAEGSLLGGDYAIVEKRNVEVNALADELAASPTNRFSGSLQRRSSRLTKFSSPGSLGRASGGAGAGSLGLSPITAREASDFSQGSIPLQQSLSGTPVGSDSPKSEGSRPWPIPTAPFALPPDQRPPSFHRRTSVSSSGSPSPRLLNQSLPQTTPGMLSLRATPSGSGAASPSPSLRDPVQSGSPNQDAPSPFTLSASPTPSPYRAPLGTWTSYSGPPVGSAPSSALSRAISMASVRLFGVPSGMTLRNAAALVRSRSFRRLTGTSSGDFPDPAEVRLLNQLEDFGQKSFVLSEFADSRLAAHFPAGPHQMGSSSQYDTTSGLGSSSSRGEGGPHAPRVPLAPRRSSSSSVHSGSSPGAESTVSAETAAAEALVLYAKSMGYLRRGIDMTRAFLDARSQNGWQGSASPEVSETVQWLRARFNESFDKANFAKARCGEMPPSAQFIDKLIFDKALEMARAAAVDELENNREGSSWDPARCLLAYETASSMLLALLDPGEEGMSLSQNSISTIEKFSRSISKRLKALQERIEPAPSPSSLT